MRSLLVGSLAACSLFCAGRAFAADLDTAGPVQALAQGTETVKSQAQPAQPSASTASVEPVAPASPCRPRSLHSRGWDLRRLCPEGTVTTPAVAVPAKAVAPVATAAEARVSTPGDVAWRDGSQDVSEAPLVSHREGPSEWYGWQILASDAASLLVTVAGSSADSSDAGAFALFGVLGYAAAPPVIHVLHDQGTRALASLGMRLAFPVLGTVVGLAASSGCQSEGVPDFCQVGYGALGLLIGTGSAMALDVALARAPAPRARVGAQLSPLVLVSDREARVGLAGRF